MNTEQLTLPSPTHGRGSPIEYLINNPELPDMMRDVAPYFSPASRQRINGMAYLGEFLHKMSDNSSAAAFSTEDAPSHNMKDFYSAIKKYIPMNKRQSIDLLLGTMDGVRQRMQPRQASNGLEGVINTLSRVNELSKMMSSMGNIRRLAEAVQHSEQPPSPNGMMEAIGSMLSDENKSKLRDLLSAFG